MDDSEKGGSRRRDDIYSKSLRAGKRTYFFDVKSTKSEDLYLTVTESKRRFNDDNGKFFYEKHKLFLYPEDFEAFTDFLTETLDKIKELSGGKEITNRSELDAIRAAEKEKEKDEEDQSSDKKEDSKTNFSDVSFEDLGDDDKTSD